MARRLIGTVLPAILLAPLVLTGCTTGGQPGGAATSSPGAVQSADEDTCDLLPREELASVLAEEATGRPIPSDGWTAGQCAWSGENSGFILTVGTRETIAAFGDPAQPDAEAKLEAFEAQAGDSARTVEGTGDAAVVSESGMAAQVGDTYVEIENLSLTEEQIIEVMRLAVANLQA